MTLTALPHGRSPHGATSEWDPPPPTHTHVPVYLCVVNNGAALCVDEEDLSLRAALSTLLLRIHTEKADWKAALTLLDRAIIETSHTKHQL